MLAPCEPRLLARHGPQSTGHGCNFNRYTTEEKAHYFTNEAELAQLVRALPDEDKQRNGQAMAEIARRRYTWDRVGEAYLSLLRDQVGT